MLCISFRAHDLVDECPSLPLKRLGHGYCHLLAPRGGGGLGRYAFTTEKRRISAEPIKRQLKPHLRSSEASGRPAIEAESDGCMIEALYVLVGATVAISLDWAVYTHLSAYLRIGFPVSPHLRYRKVALGSSLALTRTLTVGVTGVGAGLAFALNQASLWLVAVGLFVLVHSVLCAFLYRRGERP